MDATNLLLLKTLAQPKYLDMGRSPVEAIQRCFQLAEEGYVTIDEDWRVKLTKKGELEVYPTECD